MWCKHNAGTVDTWVGSTHTTEQELMGGILLLVTQVQELLSLCTLCSTAYGTCKILLNSCTPYMLVSYSCHHLRLQHTGVAVW